MEHLILASHFEIQVKGQRGAGMLSYYTGDPYALYMVINSTDGPIPWIFSRDLIRDGGGDGDVFVAIDADDVKVTVTNGVNSASILFQKQDVDDYCLAMYDMVPPGYEEDCIDWEQEFAILTKE